MNGNEFNGCILPPAPGKYNMLGFGEYEQSRTFLALNMSEFLNFQVIGCKTVNYTYR